MKLLVIGRTVSESFPAHPDISEVQWAPSVSQVACWDVELCLVEDASAAEFYTMPNSGSIVTALWGPGQNPEPVCAALEHGAVGYLKLPTLPKNVKSLLDRMIQQYRDRARLEIYHSLAEEAFWMSLITRKIPEDEDAIATEADRFGVHIQGIIQPIFIRFRVRVPAWCQDAVQAQPERDIEAQVRSLLHSDIFSAFSNVQVLTIAPHKLIVLFFVQDVKAPYNKIRDGCKAFLRSCPAIGIDSLCLMGDPSDAVNLARRIERLVRVGNDQVYLDNQFLPSRQEKRQLENPPQPNVEKYLALLDCGMFETAYTELRTYFYTPSVMPKVNNSFLTNFRYQLMDGLRDLRVSRKSGINIMQHVPEDAANSAGDSVQDFLAYFSLIISELSSYSHIANTQRNIVEEVKIHILEHLSEDLSRGRIAQRFYLSADYLDRLFRRSYGQTLTEFILQARINLAKQLLSNDDLLIADVSYKTGFLTPSHFTRAFKRSTGLTPITYRKRVQLE